MHQINRMIVHHSASSLVTTTSQIRNWHLARGWGDIGYHFVIEGDGTRRFGRPLPVQGAHAKGANSDSIGVCVVGDNTVGREKWRDIQIGELMRLWFDVSEMFGPDIKVIGHRDAEGYSGNTVCPGLDLNTFLTKWVRDRVSRFAGVSNA